MNTNKIKLYFAATLGFSSIYCAQAQVEFGLSGLGRSIISTNKLEGNLLTDTTLSKAGDTTSVNKGVSGYTLFDLTTNIKLNEYFRANAIIRTKVPFGSFFGQNVAFQFRQFQMLGKIDKHIDYQIGDIDVEATPYTVYNNQEMFSTYEAENFKMRRNLLNYENFINGNVWRLQGIQGFAKYSFGTAVKELKINAFGTRTNITNDANTPDRLLSGVRVLALQSDNISVGGTFVSMKDMVTDRTLVNFDSKVMTTDIKAGFSNDALAASFNAELGNSNYSNELKSAKKSFSAKDFFYDASVNATIKAVKLTVKAGYKEVGPGYVSPAAQTTRLNVDTATSLFHSVYSNTAQRSQILYDRFTQESIYTRTISPVLQNFAPQYSNVLPYGAATPNRRGVYLGLNTHTSLKVASAEIGYDTYKEIVGMGTTDLRSFSVIRAGGVIFIDKIVGLKRKISVSVGYRGENTKRDGVAPVDLKSSLVDAGLSVEVLKKIDLIAGVKMYNAKGKEYLTRRDAFNQVIDLPFSLRKYDSKEMISAVGLRLRFAPASSLSVNYNMSNIVFNLKTRDNYSMNQLFFNFTVTL